MNKRIKKKQLKRRGKYIPPKETWDICDYCAEWLLPRLKQFRKDTIGHPYNLTYEEWLEIIDKIIFSMEHIVNDDYILDYDLHSDEGRERWQLTEAKINEGCELLGKWFRDLWW